MCAAQAWGVLVGWATMAAATGTRHGEFRETLVHTNSPRSRASAHTRVMSLGTGSGLHWGWEGAACACSARGRCGSALLHTGMGGASCGQRLGRPMHALEPEYDFVRGAEVESVLPDAPAQCTCTRDIHCYLQGTCGTRHFRRLLDICRGSQRKALHGSDAGRVETT